jgi:hypothetical protein
MQLAYTQPTTMHARVDIHRAAVYSMHGCMYPIGSYGIGTVDIHLLVGVLANLKSEIDLATEHHIQPFHYHVHFCSCN